MDQRIVIYREAQRQAQIQRTALYGSLYEDRISKKTDINYRGDGNDRHTLDVFSPKSDEVLPVIVELHGGGYIANTKESTSVHAKYFATKGFHVVNGDYTLCPEADFAQELQEIADIFRWIYENREEYRFDIDRVYLMGDSAGGHLVLLYAMMQGSERMQRFFNVTMPPVKIKAAAPICPAFQFRYDPELLPNEGMNYILSLVFPDGVPDGLADMLDITVLAPESDFPPLHIVTTPQDDLLYNCDLRLKEALEKTGKEVEFDICVKKTHELSHVFNVLFTEWEESIDANEKIMEFFLKH